MRLPKFITTPLADYLIGRLEAGTLIPHAEGHIARPDGSIYMVRGWLVKPAWWTFGCGARVHCTLQSDNDRHLHDHPWWNISVLLRNGYDEVMPYNGGAGEWTWLRSIGDWSEVTYTRWRGAGDVVFRRATDRHRLNVAEGQPAYSLFIVGPRKRLWGFYTGPGQFTPWETYVKDKEDMA